MILYSLFVVVLVLIQRPLNTALLAGAPTHGGALSFDAQTRKDWIAQGIVELAPIPCISRLSDRGALYTTHKASKLPFDSIPLFYLAIWFVLLDPFHLQRISYQFYSTAET